MVQLMFVEILTNSFATLLISSNDTYVSEQKPYRLLHSSFCSSATHAIVHLLHTTA